MKYLSILLFAICFSPLAFAQEEGGQAPDCRAAVENAEAPLQQALEQARNELRQSIEQSEQTLRKVREDFENSDQRAKEAEIRAENLQTELNTARAEESKTAARLEKALADAAEHDKMAASAHDVVTESRNRLHEAEATLRELETKVKKQDRALRQYHKMTVTETLQLAYQKLVSPAGESDWSDEM